MSSVLSATMNAPDRLISPIAGSEDASLDRAVRPKRLADYIGPVSYTHLLLQDGFKFFFYANEHDPKHIHVQKAGEFVKI